MVPLRPLSGGPGPRRRLGTSALGVTLTLLATVSGAAEARANPEPAQARDALRTLREVERAWAGERPAGWELTPLMQRLDRALPALRGADRRLALTLLARPTDGAADPEANGYASPEAAGSPLRAGRFLVHWVDEGLDAPDLTDADATGAPDWVEHVAASAVEMAAVVNGELGWRSPESDGGLGGGDGQTDIYLKELAGSGVYGYMSLDPGQTVTETDHARFGYVVIDDDYAPAQFPGYADPSSPMRITLAHEYNHVLQAAYDSTADMWMAEATAVWAERFDDRGLHDYLQYLPVWAMLPTQPLTSFLPNDVRNVRAYGSAVWNIWLAARYGPQVVRAAWERSARVMPQSFSLAAYDAAIRARGRGFAGEFARFAAATAEWRAVGSGFADGPLYPDVQRQDTLRVNGRAVKIDLDHTSFALFAIRPGPKHGIRLAVLGRRGTSAAIALVGLHAGMGGSPTVDLHESPEGGPAAVSLDVSEGFDRLTAVVVNTDTDVLGHAVTDWLFAHDRQPFTLRATTDFTRPRVVRRAPAPSADHVSRTPIIEIGFSEPVTLPARRAVTLGRPGGRTVATRQTVRAGRRVLRVVPTRRLHAGATYRVRLAAGISDLSLNALRGPRTWRFRTATP